MDSLDKKISQVFSGTHTMTSGDIENLIQETSAEIVKVSKNIEADNSTTLDMSVAGNELEVVNQRLASIKLHRDRLTAAVPRLEQYLDGLKEAERDERQKADYTLLVKQFAANKKELAAFIERVPSFARALHEATRLKVAIRRFNIQPTSGVPVNPMDIMVSNYEPLSPPVTDAILKNTHLVASDGTVLFAPVDTSVSMPPAALPTAKPNPLIIVSEEMQHALEMRIHDTSRLHELRRIAAQRGGPDLAQVVAAQGISEDQFKRMEDSVNNKFVLAIQKKHDAEVERQESAKGNENPTS